MDCDSHIADIRPGDLPGERQPVGEAVAHPIGRGFRRQEQIERPGVLAEGADLNWLDPLAMQLLTEILAKALADVRPVGGEIQRLVILVHWLAAPYSFRGR